MGINHSVISSTNDTSASSNMENLSDVSKKVETTETQRMDEKNKKAFNVLKDQGDKAFVKHVFTGDKEETLTYAEMRSRYG